MIPDLGDLPHVYLIIPALLVLGAIAGRVPLLGRLLRLASWAAVGLLLYVTFERGQLDPYLTRFTKALDLDGQEVVGSETRVRMAQDGHFWVRATIAGVERRMLVDSGATLTALSPETARAAGLKTSDSPFPVILKTANGMVNAESTSIPELRLGNIVARDLSAVVVPGFGGTDVIGMNFLSRLQSWRVEGRTLILVPNHPQPATDG